MDRIRVAIADNSVAFRDSITDHIKQQPDMSVVSVCSDGSELIKAIEQQQPDLILMDLFMPIIDAIGILEHIQKLETVKKPATIVLSSVNNEVITNRVLALGATYFMLKPVEFEIVSNRIRQSLNADSSSSADVYGYKNAITPKNLEIEVTKMMRQIGIPAHIKGYQFIREAIMLSIKDMDIINSITKELYPTIAKIYSTTPSRVERAIRHAIESTWNRGYVKSSNQLFGYTLSTAKGKPTNAEFIALIADKLRLQYYAAN